MEFLHPTAYLWYRKIDQNGPIPSYRPELGPCWVWTGVLDRNGYGRTKAFKGTPYETPFVHRAMWIATHGPIPEGLEPDHLCRVRHCAKVIGDEYGPAHLELVTHAENKRRQAEAKTHCKQGHPLSGDNLYVDSKGHRSCRTCRRVSQERFRQRVSDGERPRPDYFYQPTGRPPGRPKRTSPPPDAQRP